MSKDHLQMLQAEILPLRAQLVNHTVYTAINSVSRLQTFMEHHVFAVWDFMSLLKSLQHQLTSVTVPWLPAQNSLSARFINEIVLGEESDEDGMGGYASHFELYLRAMKESGASTSKINCLVHSLEQGFDIDAALSLSCAPAGACEFVKQTWTYITSGKAHVIASAFTFGREDIIPAMFRKFVAGLNDQSGGGFETTNYYLHRHIELDEDSHGPMALQTMQQLCGDSGRHWLEATEAAKTALNARIRFWNSIVDAIQEKELSSAIPSIGLRDDKVTSESAVL